MHFYSGRLMHFYSGVDMDIEIKDRFGKPSVPREWFLVPFSAIEDAVERLKDGSLTKYVYDPEIAELKLRDPTV